MPTHLNAGRVAYRCGAVAPNVRERTSMSIRRHRQRTTRLPTRRQRPGVPAGALRYPGRGAGKWSRLPKRRCAHALQQIESTEDLSGMLHEVQQQFELARGQCERLVVQTCLSCQAVKCQAAGHQGRASGPGAPGNGLGPAQQGPQLRQQFGVREALCEIVVGPHLHAQDAMQAYFCQRIVGPISLSTLPPTLPAPG